MGNRIGQPERAGLVLLGTIAAIATAVILGTPLVVLYLMLRVGT